MPTMTFDRTAALTAIDETAARVIAMVEAGDLGVRVPATPQWTVAEAFGHLATVAPRYLQGAHQEGEWVDSVGMLAELNARQLAPLATTDIAGMATGLRRCLAELREVILGFGEQQPVYKFHGGEKIPADVAVGILLGEFIVHGHDIAGALGRDWPIEPAHVELIIQGVTPILPGWLEPDGARGHTGRYEIRLRGQGVHRFAFTNGRLTMNPPEPFRPDVVISADPAAFLLVVYKRISQWPAILTGKLFAYGRRPWLAFTFGSRFHQP